MPPLSKPNATWKHGLNEEERESTWKEAAGTNKSAKQHKNARMRFTRTAKEDAAEGKNGVGLTTEDNAISKNKKERLSKHPASCCAWREKPGNREKDIAHHHARMEIPGNREKDNTRSSACHKSSCRKSVQQISRRKELV